MDLRQLLFLLVLAEVAGWVEQDPGGCCSLPRCSPCPGSQEGPCGQELWAVGCAGSLRLRRTAHELRWFSSGWLSLLMRGHACARCGAMRVPPAGAHSKSAPDMCPCSCTPRKGSGTFLFAEDLLSGPFAERLEWCQERPGHLPVKVAAAATAIVYPALSSPVACRHMK